MVLNGGHEGLSIDASVLIATHNRAGHLRDTLRSLAALSSSARWEVIVVDNNSRDDTRDVVTAAAQAFPVELRYQFEAEPGKPAALNAAQRLARGDVFVFTDDDARFEVDWLSAVLEALSASGGDYVGGKVLPIWGGALPRWLHNRPGSHWAVLALLDFGSQQREFGDGIGWPLGVNMAVRRNAFLRAGPWDNRFGRQGNTLRGQEQREWCIRARAVGLRGFYAPRAIVHHIVPAERLTKRYFRRWLYWNGISRAVLYQSMKLDMESPDDSTLDFSKVPHIAGMPRYMYRSALRSLAGMGTAISRRDSAAAFEHELKLWFFAGALSQRWRTVFHRRAPG
jgi:glycosyltransferase involved in cell wall biosynthesis